MTKKCAATDVCMEQARDNFGTLVSLRWARNFNVELRRFASGVSFKEGPSSSAHRARWGRRISLGATVCFSFLFDLCTGSLHILYVPQRDWSSLPRSPENYVGASARNAGVGWDRARKLVWCGRENREREFRVTLLLQQKFLPHRVKGFPPRATYKKVVSCKV